MYPQDQQQIQRPMGGNGRYRGFMMGRRLGQQRMQTAPQSQAMPAAPPTPAPTGPQMTKDPATGQAVWGMPAPPEHSVDPTPPQAPMPGGGGAPPTNAQIAGANSGTGRDQYLQQINIARAWRPPSGMQMRPQPSQSAPSNSYGAVRQQGAGDAYGTPVPASATPTTGGSFTDMVSQIQSDAKDRANTPGYNEFGQASDKYGTQGEQQPAPWRPRSEMVMRPRPMPQQAPELQDYSQEPQPRQRPGSGIVY